MREDPISNDSAWEQTAAQPFGGRRLGAGRFTVLRQLGRGGMGSVWLARDMADERLVALKFLPSAVAHDAAGLANLRRECRHAERLEHPHIVGVQGLHEHPGEAPFLAMKYVDGPTLNQLRAETKDGLLAWEFLAPIAAQLCEALVCAHAAKVIHRDLKPANLMLDSAGRLKLADFGIAATVSDTMSRVTGAAFASGTTAYMSPQQVNGELPRETDDIYSAGAALFELLTGTPPFFSGELVHQVLNKPAPTLKQRLAELGKTNSIPAHVESAILACLDKNPARRPQSAAELAARLHLGEKPGLAVQLSRALRSRKRVLALVLMAMVACVSIWLFRPVQSKPDTRSSAGEISTNKAVDPVVAPSTPVQGGVLLFADDFQRHGPNGIPNQWDSSAFQRFRDAGGICLVTNEGGMKFLRLQAHPAMQKATIFKLLPLAFTPRFLEVSAALRVSGLRAGRETDSCEVTVVFFGGTPQSLAIVRALKLSADADWTRLKEKIAVPPGTKSLRIHLQLLAENATGDFDDLKILTFD